MARTSSKSRAAPKRRNSSGLPTRKPGNISPEKKTFLAYGVSGTGKTTLASTFPGPVLYIDLKDGGDDSLEGLDNVEIFDAKTTEDLDQAFWYLKKNPDKYGTVVIDTVTQMQAFYIDRVAGSKKLKKGKKLGDWGTMSQQDWGTVSNEMKTCLMNFRSLDLWTVFLAQEKRIEGGDQDDDGVGGVVAPEIGPAVMKSVAQLICASASIIGNTFIRNRIVKKGLKKTRKIDYCLRVGPNPVYVTKIRKARDIIIPDFITDPSFGDIENLRKGIAANGSQEESEKRNRKSGKSGKRSDSSSDRPRLGKGKNRIRRSR